MKRFLAACLITTALSGPALANVRTSAQPLQTSVANNSLAFDLFQSETVMGLEVTGVTAAGATLTIQGSTDGRPLNDPNKVWFATVGVPFTCPSPSATSTVNADGPYKVDVSGLTNVRVIVTATGTGNALVSLNAIPAATLGTCGGSGGGGATANVNIHDSAGGALTSTGGALNVAGTFTANLGAFTSAATYSNLAVTNTSAFQAFPAGATTGSAIKLYNRGPDTIYYVVNSGATAATTNMSVLPPQSWDTVVVGVGQTGVSAITSLSTQTASLNMELGTGLPSGTGGPINRSVVLDNALGVTFFEALAGVDAAGTSHKLGVNGQSNGLTAAQIPFTTNGSYINNTSVPTSSTNAALTGSPLSVVINNVGSTSVMVKPVSSGAGTVTAATADLVVPASSVMQLGTNGNGFLAYASVGGIGSVQISEGFGQFAGAGGGGSTGGASGNVFQANIPLNGSVSSAATTQIIAASGTTTIYLVNYSEQTDGAAAGNATFQIVSGTGSNCAGSQTALTPVWNFSANNGIAEGSIGVLAVSAAGAALCIKTTTANQVNWRIGAVQQ